MILPVAYEDDLVTLYQGDCLEPDMKAEDYALALVGDVDAVITDPPYGDTTLAWDRTPHPEWIACAAQVANTLWCFGSLRFHLTQYRHFIEEDWELGQEVVWEKHNGSGFAADRFKRVHELAVHWYRGDWSSQHRNVPVVQMFGERARKVATGRGNTPHTGAVGDRKYESHGERLMRSVIQVRNEQGRAVHPTQKPLGILRPLIEYSVPEGGIVLDPFAGSGSTLLAARAMGRRAIGIEINPDYCKAAVARLSQMEMAA